MEYLGYVIDKEGLRKNMSKVDAIVKMSDPKNVTQVKAFVGMVNYYAKFISNLAKKLSPLYKLLQKNVEFKWNDDCKNSMEEIKREIVSDNCLVHFNPDLKIKLACDASRDGIGAVLLHVYSQWSGETSLFCIEDVIKS